MAKKIPPCDQNGNTNPAFGLPQNKICDCCLVDHVKENGCALGLPPHPRKVIGGSRYQENHDHREKLCDAIIFWNNEKDGVSLVVAELKSGGFSASGVIEQLQGGARLAEAVVVFDGTIAFAPLLFKKKGMHSIERKVLSRARVRFRGKGHPIQTMSCSDSIQSASPWKI